MTPAPPSSDLVGYALEDLQAFLLAAERRADALRQAVAEVRGDRPAEPPLSASARRNRVAEAWLAAQQQAARIRGDADREALAITEAARRVVDEAGGARQGSTP